MWSAEPSTGPVRPLQRAFASPALYHEEMTGFELFSMRIMLCTNLCGFSEQVLVFSWRVFARGCAGARGGGWDPGSLRALDT